MQYIEEKIGDDYLNWINTDIILIKAPTGSGKTQFCLRRLLCNRAIRKRERILYLVNRKVLKKQLLEEIKKCEKDLIFSGMQNINLEEHIAVRTYQEIEHMLTEMDAKQSIEKLQSYQNMYDIVIYDECHYFYADSNFNTYTQLSYDFLTHCFNEKIQVFMSATMENMKDWIKLYPPKYVWEQQMMRYNPYHTANCGRAIEQRLKEYDCEKDYSYIELKIFDKVEDIEKIIVNEINEKWLIFVDNKDMGRKLSDFLLKSSGEKIGEKDIIYIDADYSKNEDAANSVNFLAKNDKLLQKIVITTAVMDNGISFHDENLRNLIILADTEEEFIQMLGRKRKDNKNVNVYFCRRDVKHFQKRLQLIKRQTASYLDNAKEIKNNYCWGVYTEGNAFVENENVSPFTLYRAWYWQCTSNNMRGTINGKQIGIYIPQPMYQQKFLKSILESPEFYNNTRSYVYYYQGLVAINEFSCQRLFDLERFYQSMIEKFETSKWAFAKEVMHWLGYSEELLQTKIEEASIGQDQKYCNEMIEILETYMGKEIDSDENKKLKKEISEILKYFMVNNNNFESKEITAIQKGDRTLSEKSFNKIMNEIGLDYMMEKPDKSHYLIKKREENN